MRDGVQGQSPPPTNLIGVTRFVIGRFPTATKPIGVMLLVCGLWGSANCLIGIVPLVHGRSLLTADSRTFVFLHTRLYIGSPGAELRSECSIGF